MGERTLKCWNLRIGGHGGSFRCAPIGLSVGPGEVVAIIGPSGSGKTSLIEVLAGIKLAKTGSVFFGDRNVRERRMRSVIGYQSADPVLPPELTGREWLWYLTGHRSGRTQNRVALLRSAAAIADLGVRLENRLGTYTRPMAARLSVAQALGLGGEAAILDNPFLGMDVTASTALSEKIAHYASAGRVAVIASSELGPVERIATRVVLLAGGGVVADTAVGPLLKDRVAELTLTVEATRGASRLTLLFSQVQQTEFGVAIPLIGGLTMERILGVCRSERIPVAGSRIRHARLEDLLQSQTGRRSEGHPAGVGMSGLRGYFEPHDAQTIQHAHPPRRGV